MIFLPVFAFSDNIAMGSLVFVFSSVFKKIRHEKVYNFFLFGYHHQPCYDSRRKNMEATDLGCWGAPGIRLLIRVRLCLMGCLDCQLPHNNF